MKNIAKGDLWNRLIKVRDSTKYPDEKRMAEILLSQLNTAGGKELMKNEITNFLNQYEDANK